VGQERHDQGGVQVGDIQVDGLFAEGAGGVDDQQPQAVAVGGDGVRAGLALALITGPLIFSSDPNMYLRNASFRFKLMALVIAIIYNYTIHRWVALKQASGGLAVLTGAISLVLWASVIFGGIFIAFV
jgi:hypothetical protein